jgi:protein subunit release factor A
MTDHRVDLTLYSLERIMEGELQQLLDALRENDVDDRIKLAIVRTEEGR